MNLRSILPILIILDLAVLITCSMMYISDDVSAPGDMPVERYEPQYELIEETDTHKIYRLDGYMFMDTYEDGKTRTRLIAQTELHMTLIPVYS